MNHHSGTNFLFFFKYYINLSIFFLWRIIYSIIFVKVIFLFFFNLFISTINFNFVNWFETLFLNFNSLFHYLHFNFILFSIILYNYIILQFLKSNSKHIPRLKKEESNSISICLYKFNYFIFLSKFNSFKWMITDALSIIYVQF